MAGAPGPTGTPAGASTAAPSRLRILLADDHAVLRAGLRSLLTRELDMEVVGEAATGAEAIRLAGQLRPDVVLMDITMPEMGGLEATAEMTSRFPEVRVLILTLHDDQQFVLPALRAGAAGYVVKHAGAPELLGAIRAVARGERFLHSAITGYLIDQCVEERPPLAGQPLSSREMEVLALIARGLSYKEMARHLGVSPKTVATYRERIKEKLALHSRADLVGFALDGGMLRSGG